MPQALPLYEAGDLNMLDITEREYIQLTGFIKTNYGINLGEGKKALLLSRLQKVLAEQQFESFTEYYGFLRRDATGKALSTLVDKVTTNHTYFMREPAHFSYLKDKLRLLQRGGALYAGHADGRLFRKRQMPVEYADPGY
jgi:hypothetical protein